MRNLRSPISASDRSNPSPRDNLLESYMPHPTLAELNDAIAYVAEMITGRPDGDTYLPIFERLEEEIKAHAAKESTIERAKRIARETTERAAA